MFLGHLHNPYLTNQIHILSAKVIYNLVEHIVSKENSQAAGKLLTTLLESSVDKLDSMTAIHVELVARTERQKRNAERKGTDDKKDADDADITYIEKARPISHATYTILKVEELYHGTYTPTALDSLTLTHFVDDRLSARLPHVASWIPTHSYGS